MVRSDVTRNGTGVVCGCAVARGAHVWTGIVEVHVGAWEPSKLPHGGALFAGLVDDVQELEDVEQDVVPKAGDAKRHRSCGLVVGERHQGPASRSYR